MQKARIITARAESVQRLADQLRERGYSVEIMAPGESGFSEAELEIEVETCSREHALQRAAQLAEANDADVFIDAGCFPSETADSAAPVLLRGGPSVSDAVSGVAAGIQNKRDLLAKALREQRAIMRQARQAERKRREQESALRAAEQAEQERLAREAEVHRASEERKRIVRQQQEEEEARRIAEQERAGRQQPAGQMQEAQVRPQVLFAKGRALSQRSKQWRLAVVVSGVFAAMLMLGWSAVTRVPVAPLPASVVNRSGIQEQVPFGAATAAPIPAGARKSVLNRPSSKPRNPSPSRKKDSALRKGETKVRPAAHRSSSHSMPDNYIARDEVRYFRGTKPAAVPPKDAKQHATLKRYSDMQ